MPPKSGRQLEAEAAILHRHESHDEELSDEEVYGDVIHMNLEDDDDLTNSMNLKTNLDHTWRDIDTLFRQIDVNRCEAADKLADRFLEGDFDALEDDRRGRKHRDGFYDLFPELETEAKAFVIESCSRKSSDFSTVDLAKYLDK
ncbi:unnamed protein product, partial [Rotaria sordida]